MIDFDGDKKISAPMMQRTKAQLETAYAPGALFTFESNLVICKSVPAREYNQEQLKPYTRDLIYMGIDEALVNWLNIGMRADCGIPITPDMCVDKDALFNEQLDPAEKLFAFAEPGMMGYTPDLLTFVCTHCKTMVNFDSLNQMQNNLSDFNAPCEERSDGGRCNWQQMDIVFIHPNGNYTAPLPYIQRYDERSGQISGKFSRCTCGEIRVKLIRHGAQLGKYQLICASCKRTRTGTNDYWLQNDREYLQKLKADAGKHPFFVRMKPISARSNSVFYVKQDMVIDFNDDKQLLQIVNSPSSHNLLQWLAIKYDMPVEVVPLEVKKTGVIDKLGEVEWQEYEEQLQSIKGMNDMLNIVPENSRPAIQTSIRNSERIMREMEQKWEADGVYQAAVEFPTRLSILINERKDLFAPRYDPFRLHVEHEVLLKEVVTYRKMENGLAHFTALDNLDEYVGPDNENKRQELNNKHRMIMDRIGIDTMGLVRNFKTVNFSFGYSRVDSKPVTTYINEQEVPVRLRLFKKTRFSGLDKPRHPIFTLKQDNEAIYVRLNEDKVRQWLATIDTGEPLTDKPIGLQFLENAVKMSQYLTEIDNPDYLRPAMSLAIYTLVHSYAHHVMNAVSEYSGLGTGSLSEYLFPADLAFIVYRKGMTMDMGNLTSILRNNAPAFLDYLNQPRNLSCGSGSLCTSRGGACPDCLLVHEMSCIAQNKLLSRSVLAGQGHPGLYGFHANITGFLDISRGNSSDD